MGWSDRAATTSNLWQGILVGQSGPARRSCVVVKSSAPSLTHQSPSILTGMTEHINAVVAGVTGQPGGSVLTQERHRRPGRRSGQIARAHGDGATEVICVDLPSLVIQGVTGRLSTLTESSHRPYEPRRHRPQARRSGTTRQRQTSGKGYWWGQSGPARLMRCGQILRSAPSLTRQILTGRLSILTQPSRASPARRAAVS